MIIFKMVLFARWVCKNRRSNNVLTIKVRHISKDSLLIRIKECKNHKKINSSFKSWGKYMETYLYRKYTIGEIINSVIKSGFTLRSFDEHPSWSNESVPGEFILVAIK